jgi:hypothetical protein
MNDAATPDRPNGPDPRGAHRVRLPGFVSEDDVGLGDAVKRVTRAFGVAPCGGCERRAAALNHWLRISGMRRNSN